MSPRVFASHVFLALRLHARSWQALVYGYALPVLFLVSFAALFRGQQPPLLAEMGQLATLTILGGACIGFPTTLVAERERGVWRRHRLLPVSGMYPFSTTWLARLLLVFSGVALQVVLAHVLFGAPWPDRPWLLAGTVAGVSAAFLGLGLVVAVLADGVPAVQALGQCLFLPMVILGGVGVPAEALPEWAQRFSVYMPGRYAVELLQQGFEADHAGLGGLFAAGALAVMGSTGYAVGSVLFRWDGATRLGWREKARAGAVLVPWVVFGWVAGATEHWQPRGSGGAYLELSEEQIASISFEQLPGDGDLISPLAPAFGEDLGGEKGRRATLLLAEWPKSLSGRPAADVRFLLSAIGLADVAQDARERELARAAYNILRARYGRTELRHLLGWIILNPDAGEVVTSAPELGIRRGAAEAAVRYRTGLYARKFLARVQGKIPE